TIVILRNGPDQPRSEPFPTRLISRTGPASTPTPVAEVETQSVDRSDHRRRADRLPVPRRHAHPPLHRPCTRRLHAYLALPPVPPPGPHTPTLHVTPTRLRLHASPLADRLPVSRAHNHRLRLHTCRRKLHVPIAKAHARRRHGAIINHRLAPHPPRAV